MKICFGAWLVAVTALGGCGSGGGAGSSANGHGFSSSIGAGTPLDQLSDGQLETLCGEAQAFATSSGLAAAETQTLCLLAGAIAAEVTAPQTDAAAQAACLSAFNACLASPPGTASCPTKAMLNGCTATVGAYGVCLDDAATAATTLAQSLPTCADLTVAALSTQASSLAPSGTPPSCQALQSQCAGLSS